MLKTGMLLGERYEIVSKIGTGGMADVYKAKDRKLNRYVAAKILKREFREDTTFIKKFRSEAQAAAGLTHPNIVNIFDVGEDENMHYIVMELIEGITLKEYISKKGKLSVKEATSIAIQVSMGLEAAHSHGIVHRDVKPQNIMINIDGKVKVTDFGIARAASSNTISSNVMGTVHYSSPEQVRGGYSDEKSDIYSLGIVLYEMLTGKVPFDGDTTVAIAIKHLQEEMIPASVYAPELPFSLEQVINKCTQKSVDRRYQKMEDVIADLKRTLVDPDGDFVKMTPVDEGARTLVINDSDLSRIRNNTGKVTIQKTDPFSDEDDYEEEVVYRGDKNDKNAGKKKKKKKNVGLKVIAVVAGVAVLSAAVYLIGERAGLFEKGEPSITAVPEEKEELKDQSQQPEEKPGDMAETAQIEVPQLVGMTVTDAESVVQELSLKLQLSGEEFSEEPAGTIIFQKPEAGSQAEEGAAIYYKVSKGSEQKVMPDYVLELYEAPIQELLEMGMTVVVQKEYDDYAEEDFILYTIPAAGESLNPGDTVYLVVSDNDVLYGEVPDETYTPDGQSADASEKALSGDAEPKSSDEGNVEAEDTSGVWICTQKLDNPGADYQGGPLKLELIQKVNGESKKTVVVEDTVLQFPYQLDIVGASGISDGELHIYEEVDGEYQVLGYYPIKFKKQ